MSRLQNSQVHTTEGLLGISTLMDRLDNVRKRKRSFGGQMIDMDAVHQRMLSRPRPPLAAGRQRERVR